GQPGRPAQGGAARRGAGPAAARVPRPHGARVHPHQARRQRLEHLAHGAAARHRAHEPAKEDAGARPGGREVAGVVRVAAVLGVVGVALGAFGAHGLRDRLAPGMLEVYRTGVLYHLLHAVAMLAVALGADRLARPRAVGALFAGGIVIFSGSLYALA